MSILYEFIKKFIENEKYNTIIIIIVSCIVNILKINLISYIVANIIKSVQTNDIKNIFCYYKYFILVSIIYLIINYYYKNVQINYLLNLRHWIRENIIENLLKANYENYISNNYGKLGTTIFRISNNCYYFFNNIINIIIPNLTLMLIIFIYFLVNNFTISSIFLMGNLVIIFYIYYNFNELSYYNNKYEECILNNEYSSSELLNNFDKIIYRGKIKDELSIINKNSKNVIEKGSIFYNNSINKSFIINGFIYLLLFILIFYLIYIYIKKKINSTIFITFLTILILYKDIIINTIDNMPDYIEFLCRLNTINRLFNNINISNIDNKSLILKEHNLEFNNIKWENINFKYQSQKENILNNLNLEINLNYNIVGITGISGKGKSTFIKLLIKMHKYEGNIYIDNINIKDLNTNYIRKNIIYVNQDARLFDLNLIENLYYGYTNKGKSSVYLEEIMKFERIKELFKNMDLNKKIVKSGENLSGGQRQVINIINGLISDSKIVILDEPTNALDNLLKIEIINVIKYFKKYKKCIIIISHDKDIIKYFDEIIKL